MAFFNKYELHNSRPIKINLEVCDAVCNCIVGFRVEADHHHGRKNSNLFCDFITCNVSNMHTHSSSDNAKTTNWGSLTKIFN